MASNVLVVGSVGIDTIETPYGRAAGVLGGSAVYAAVAASKFARPAIVSVVGKDFSGRHRNFLLSQKIAVDGLVTVDAPTFRWHGKYEFDMGVAKTLKTELGSLALAGQVKTGYQKILTGLHTPGVRSEGSFLLLANLDPDIQAEIAQQFRGIKVLDTMNYWIERKKRSVEQVIEHADCLVLNENEARELFGTPNLIKAGHAALELGPEYVVIKKGEHGSMLFSEHGFFAVPGYPLLTPIDPTGAGDSFAGALVGYLAATMSKKPKKPDVQPVDTPGVSEIGFELVRRAVVYATAVSSFTVEGMATTRLANLKSKEIEERVAVFKQMRQF